MDKLSKIEQRIREKVRDYREYQFTLPQHRAIWAFFDLSQEYNHIEDIYRISVLIPKIYFKLFSTIYIMKDDLVPVMSSSENIGPDILPSESPYTEDGNFIVPIRGNEELLDLLPNTIKICCKNVIGMILFTPVDNLKKEDFFFLEKYVNRIGYALHNCLLAQKNIEHIDFIKGLVTDIGHNVIVPNMFFKVYLNQLKRKIGSQENMINQLNEYLGSSIKQKDDFIKDKGIGYYLNNILDTLDGIKDEYDNINNHYKNTSLFLETLMRKSHFDKGKYIIEKKRVNIFKTIIEPQLWRYKRRLEEKGIEVNRTLIVPDEEFILMADPGLLAQVYANFLSNAVKYTRTEYTENGEKVKFIALGKEDIPDYFGKNRDGIKFNLFSTGPRIPPEENRFLFDEGFRCSNTENTVGTGHGLRFVKEVIALHGGAAGYEATPIGNNFYFVLPKSAD